MDGDVASGSTQAHRDLLPQAPPRAGDERDPTGEIHDG
jgi:hypothetical protein